MGVSKSILFSKKHNSISSLCKAFGHPARVFMMENILEGGEWVCEDFQEIIPLSRTTIWQHLQQLEAARLIEGKFQNDTFIYKINNAELEAIKTYFKEIL